NERKLTIELQCMQRPERARQGERRERFRGKKSLVGEIVNRENGGGAVVVRRQQRGYESRLPVMTVHDVGTPRDVRPSPRERERDVAEDREALRVVGPGFPARIEIRMPLPREGRSMIDEP